MIMQPFCLRIHGSRTDSAGNKHDFFLFHFFKVIRYQFRRTSERPYKISDLVPGLQRNQLVGRDADRLECQCDGSCLPVIITDRKRNTLRCLINPYNDELPRLTGPGYTRCINDLLVDCCRELLCFQNLKHILPPNIFCSDFIQ